MTTRIAAAQFAAGTDKRGNRASIGYLVSTAATAGAKLVVLPENAMYPDTGKDLSAQRESLDGEFVANLKMLAQAHNIAIVAGMAEERPGTDKSSNTVVAIGADGADLGVYRKVHLYDAFGYKESDRVEAAEFAALTFTIDDLTYGVITCYDLRFPEIARALVDRGTDVLLVPAAWMAGEHKIDHWEILLRARAIENTIFVLGAGQTGPHCTGYSAIIDPMGVVLALAGEHPGVVVADLDPADISRVRETNPSLVNRRFGVYQRSTPTPTPAPDAAVPAHRSEPEPSAPAPEPAAPETASLMPSATARPIPDVSDTRAVTTDLSPSDLPTSDVPASDPTDSGEESAELDSIYSQLRKES